MKTINQRFNQLAIQGALLFGYLTIGHNVCAQSSAEIQLHASLSLTGTPGLVYAIEASSDLEPGAWRCIDFVTLPDTPIPFIWTDTSASVQTQGKRFYRASEFASPTNMVFIPPGTFRMGSPDTEDGRNPGAEGNEGPQTHVLISHGFWIGKYEVTQGEVQELMDDNPSAFTGDQSLPVDSVSLIYVGEYCARLTNRERNARRIPSNCAFRIPTEAEWEYACRAMTTDRRFYYGDDPAYSNLGEHAWFYDNSGSMTHPVGQKRPNQWGLFDMHGNVAEWVADGFDIYPGGSRIDYFKPVGFSTKYMIRGGSWQADGPSCRSAWRGVTSLSPVLTGNYIGFRVVLAAAP